MSTTRVSPRMPSVSCEFEWFLIVPAHPPLPLSVLSSCCSLCQAHHVCVRAPTIAHVLIPWCRDIHSLIPVPPKEAGEQKRTMRYQFLNPSVLVFFFFCPNGAVFFFFSLPPALLKAAPLLSTSASPDNPSSGFFFPSFFNHRWFLQWNGDTPLYHVA